MSPVLSVVIPTRERAVYLHHCIRSCLQNAVGEMEVLILDNASADNTQAVVAEFSDPRIRYIRNDTRLSMRDNFEKGVQLARGEILCCIGDDDGLLPHAVEEALQIFGSMQVEALSAARAHYHWPDLLWWGRDTAFVPRAKGIELLNSRSQLRTLLTDCDYYRLPCLYQGFVRRSLVHKVVTQQGRLFLSNQVDIFSAIALSMQDVQYAFSRSPLIINGSSRRSNGASHFGGGGELEKSLWKAEDDLGFLPPFENSLSIGALIVESAIRYGREHAVKLEEIFEVADIRYILERECQQRSQIGGSADARERLFETAGLVDSRPTAGSRTRFSDYRATRLIRQFLKYYPLPTDSKGITNVHECAIYVQELLARRRLGFLVQPSEQFGVALRAIKT